MINELALVLLDMLGQKNPAPANLEEFITIFRLEEHEAETIYLAYATHPVWKPFLDSVLRGESRVTTKDFLERMNKESIIAQQRMYTN